MGVPAFKLFSEKVTALNAEEEQCQVSAFTAETREGEGKERTVSKDNMFKGEGSCARVSPCVHFCIGVYAQAPAVCSLCRSTLLCVCVRDENRQTEGSRLLHPGAFLVTTATTSSLHPELVFSLFIPLPPFLPRFCRFPPISVLNPSECPSQITHYAPSIQGNLSL